VKPQRGGATRGQRAQEGAGAGPTTVTGTSAEAEPFRTVTVANPGATGTTRPEPSMADLKVGSTRSLSHRANR